MSQAEIVILNAFRTPIGSFNGYYKNTSTPKLGAAVIRACYEKTGLKADQIDGVNMGCVLPAGLGQAPARQAALKADLSINTPCVTVNKMCSSALQAIISAHDSIVVGTHKIMIAGGMENMTRAPYLIPKARFGYRYGHGELWDHMQKDGLEDAYDQKAMGVHAESCVAKYKFSREEQDDFALESLKRAQEAASNNAFADEIIPIELKKETVNQDEGPIVIKAEKIKKLRAAFIAEGTITAANASSISDGAAAVTLTTAAHANTLGVKPIARVLAHTTYAHEPQWFTTAPIHAIKQILDKVNWSVDDVDLFEINEAFAVVTMAAMKELNIPHDKVNVNGGACVLGHPIGATGARILVTLIHALKTRGLKKGIASLCIGGGEAQAIAIEIL
jgi:acetyl-CoA C-acetyltransferase